MTTEVLGLHANPEIASKYYLVEWVFASKKIENLDFGLIESPSMKHTSVLDY